MFTVILDYQHLQLQPTEPSPYLQQQQSSPKKLLKVQGILPSNQEEESYEGVAMTVMLRAPQWFHRRYTAMLHNILANIPPTWVVQVFYNEDWLKTTVLPLHPGMQQIRANNKRVIWTPLPKAMTKEKPKEIMKSNWLWESVVAENVFVFSGNGALCTNSEFRIENFLGYDYVGAPWRQQGGMGGDGSTHSFRHRSAMLQILEKNPPNNNESPDHLYFVKSMLQEKTYKVADRNTTLAFGGVVSSGDVAPLLLSGTQAKLNWTVRDTLLGVCPELKMIFPSLHEPACFGAHPNGEKCKETICALNEKEPGHGC
jgi:hypothetical protein